MAEVIVDTRNVFLNSEHNIQGRGTNFVVRCHDLLTLPTDSSFFRIILNEFSLRRTWYKVNSSNNVFRVMVVTNIYNFFNCVITPGDYQTRSALVDAIVNALKKGIADNGFSYIFTAIVADKTTIETDKIFKITITKSAQSPDLKIFFQKNPAINDGITPYSNAYRLFGGRVNVPGDGYSEAGGTASYNWGGSLNFSDDVTKTYITITGYYPMCLDTESHIYLRTQMVNDSLSNHHGLSNLTDNAVIGSNILGKIVITEDWCSYDSSDLSGGSWFLDLPYKSITDLSFYISDGDGKPLPLIDPSQDTTGGLFVKMSLIVQAIKRLNN